MRHSTDPLDLEKYLGDESRMPGGRAEEVFWPDSVDEAAEALATCAARGLRVTVSGAGTGIAGGRVPLGGAVLATERLASILALERGADGGWMRVQAGVPLATVQQAALDAGLWYPPDPTENGAFIGGTIATNASGGRTFRYGPTRRWVRRIVVALADGGILDLPRGACREQGGVFEVATRDGRRIVVPAPDWEMPRTSKHASGYFSAPGMDLVDLFIGSEGTLGVVLEADLDLIPAPEAMISGILFFEDEPTALAMVAAARGDRVRGAHGVTPAALEFFDRAALAIVREKGAPVPAGAAAGIFFEQPVVRAAEFDALLEAWAELAAESGASDDSWLAQEPEEQARFREFRHAVPWTINELIARRGVRKVSTDTAVPEGGALELLARYRGILDGAGLESAAFGHIGDDHIHVNILPRDAAELERAKELYRQMVVVALEMGGTISAEHGLGKLKGRDLGLMFPAAALERMRAIRAALDPGRRLGCGTLLD